MTVQKPDPAMYVTIGEAAKHYSVSTSTLRAWIKNEIIPKESYIKLGTTYRFNLRDMTTALLMYESPEKEDGRFKLYDETN